MDARRFDNLARALGHPISRRGVLGGSLARLGDAVSGLAQTRPPQVTVCEKGHTLVLPARAAQVLLAHGATPGPCTNPGAGGGPQCQEKLFGVCTIPPFGDGCCGDLVCTPTAAPIFTACQFPCTTDGDCRRRFPTSKLVCRQDFPACPFQKCCLFPL